MDIGSWKAYYWNFFEEFGGECYRTWRGEMLASVLMVGFIFLINRAGIDLRTGLLASGYTLATFSTWHLLRTPWLLQKRLSSEGNLHWGWGIFGMAFGVGSVVLWAYTAAWFYTMQPPVTITARLPDSRDVQIAQLRQELEASKQPEAPDSLRRRTSKVADDFTAFLIERQKNKPPDASPNSADPNPSEERKKEIERSQAFYRGIEDYYFKNFRSRFVGIIKEYNSKGVRTGYLESDFTQRVPYIPAPGSVMDGMDELSLFRDLAYHVDARDHLIVF